MESGKGGAHGAGAPRGRHALRQHVGHGRQHDACSGSGSGAHMRRARQYQPLARYRCRHAGAPCAPSPRPTSARTASMSGSAMPDATACASQAPRTSQRMRFGTPGSDSTPWALHARARRTAALRLSGVSSVAALKKAMAAAMTALPPRRSARMPPWIWLAE